MAYINIDERVINNLKSENIIKILNIIIDNELAKDVSRINTKLINDCVDALISIEEDENNKFSCLIPLMSADDFLTAIKPREKGWKSLNIFARVAVVAAVLAGSTFTVNAAVESATGIDMIESISGFVHEKLEDIGLINTNGIDQFDADDDDDETKAITTTEVSEATTETTIRAISLQQTATSEHGIDQFDANDDDDEEITTKISEQSTTRKPPQTTIAEPVTKPGASEEIVLKALKAEFDNFKTDYIYGEALTYDGLSLIAVYSDGSKKAVSINECNYTKSVDMNTTGNHTLRIIYNNCTIKINITVRPDEDTRGSKICSNDLFEYLLTNQGAYITAYHGNDTRINLDYVDGYKVIAIGANVFAGNDLEFITAQNVEKIFPSAFKNCSSLIDCYIPSAIYIGSSAFEGCSSLQEAVYDNELNYFGESVYKDTAIDTLIVPKSISEIPESFCENCINLKNVIFSGSVTKIGSKAFSECTSLEMITGTANIAEVGSYAFYNDSSVDFDETLFKLEIADDYAFAYCNNINFESLSENIKHIGAYSFLYCYKLTKAVIPSCITEIPEGAFRGAHISNLIISEGVKVIDDYAFMSTAFSSINLPSTIEKIGTYSLYSINLKTAYFDKNIKSIGANAVLKSKKLTFYVYDNSIALDYAMANNINYILLKESENPNHDGIDNFNGEDD